MRIKDPTDGNSQNKDHSKPEIEQTTPMLRSERATTAAAARLSALEYEIGNANFDRARAGHPVSKCCLYICNQSFRLFQMAYAAVRCSMGT